MKEMKIGIVGYYFKGVKNFCKYVISLVIRLLWKRKTFLRLFQQYFSHIRIMSG